MKDARKPKTSARKAGEKEATQATDETAGVGAGANGAADAGDAAPTETDAARAAAADTADPSAEASATAPPEGVSAGADTAEQEEVLSPTAQLTAERDELREKWLRALADLDNLRKRSRREIQDARRFAQVELLRSLLDIADNFDRAVASLGPESDVTADAVREGVTLIHQNFRGLLRERGVEPIEALGREFDPNEHEAVAQMASEDHAAGIVVEVVQQGYRFGDLVLRPARVVIAS